jgi:hypothetical protein
VRDGVRIVGRGRAGEGRGLARTECPGSVGHNRHSRRHRERVRALSRLEGWETRGCASVGGARGNSA